MTLISSVIIVEWVNLSTTFLREIDPVAHKKYVYEKFKENRIGQNFREKNPEQVSNSVKESKPVFKKKINIDLPSAFDVKESEVYLHRRAILVEILLCTEV